MADPGRESELCGRFLDQLPLDAAVAALANSQHAVFEVGQLRDVGLTARAVQKRAAAGRLHRVYRGVYSLVPVGLLSREGHWMAAVLACGPGAVLSHRSAAALLGLRPTKRARIDVTVPRRSAREHPRIEVHRSTTLTAADTERESNIPCTTVARTQLDLADVIGRRPLERAFDQAEALEVFDLRALEDQLARNPYRRGAHVVRSVLAEHYAGSTPTWSEFEERFLAFARTAGLPRPEVNYWIVLDDGSPAIRADFAWPAQRVIVETDGRRTHGTRQAFERDRRNDLRLAAARWRPVRVTWRRLDEEPALVEASVRALLGS
jgi:predicted transcriptional regulator of viral defense system